MSLTENTGGEQERISFTLFSKAAGILTKRMKLADGQLVKDASECRMSKGQAETVTLAPAQFGAFLQGLKQNQAIAHGICEHSTALIVSKAKENGARAADGLPVIARSKEQFRSPAGPGLLMLDHDKASATCELPRCLNQTAYLLPYKRVPFYYIKRRPFDI